MSAFMYGDEGGSLYGGSYGSGYGNDYGGSFNDMHMQNGVEYQSSWMEYACDHANGFASKMSINADVCSHAMMYGKDAMMYTGTIKEDGSLSHMHVMVIATIFIISSIISTIVGFKIVKHMMMKLKHKFGNHNGDKHCHDKASLTGPHGIHVPQPSVDGRAHKGYFDSYLTNRVAVFAKGAISNGLTMFCKYCPTWIMRILLLIWGLFMRFICYASDMIFAMKGKLTGKNTKQISINVSPDCATWDSHRLNAEYIMSSQYRSQRDVDKWREYTIACTVPAIAKLRAMGQDDKADILLKACEEMVAGQTSNK